MSTPVLHLLAGPNGAGKSTFADRILIPATHLPFINADRIATSLWPCDEEAHAYQASQVAAHERSAAMRGLRSFITETVFSHPSKADLVQQAVDYGYLVTLHVLLVPEDVAVGRVSYRVNHGGHTVPETKIRERYRRLWTLIATSRDSATRAVFYDNSVATPAFRTVAVFERGALVGQADWPSWTPAELL
jgi:predicted ABC-type ATPase